MAGAVADLATVVTRHGRAAVHGRFVVQGFRQLEPGAVMGEENVTSGNDNSKIN